VRKVTLGIFLLSLGIPTVAAADPVVLASARIGVDPDGRSSVSIDGSRSGRGGEGWGAGGFSSGGFNVGHRVDMSRQISFSVRHSDVEISMSPVIAHGGSVAVRFQLSVSPTVAAGGPLTPVTISGLQLVAHGRHDPPLLMPDVAATGTPSIAGPEFMVDGLFGTDPVHGALLTLGAGSAPAATPEPATLVLLATGVVPLMLRRRRHQ